MVYQQLLDKTKSENHRMDPCKMEPILKGTKIYNNLPESLKGFDRNVFTENKEHIANIIYRKAIILKVHYKSYELNWQNFHTLFIRYYIYCLSLQKRVVSE